MNITDINDNRPVFSESTYETAVVENTTVGETVHIVMATDQDSGTNGEITYEFQSPSKCWPISLPLPLSSPLLSSPLLSSPLLSSLDPLFTLLPPPSSLQVNSPSMVELE